MMIAHSSGAAARGLPVYLPTLQANATPKTFVLNIAGGSSANETGAGGGLSGADLVFQQNGGIAGVSSGRRLVLPNQYFSVTAAFAARFFNLPEWTYALDLASVALVANTYFAKFDTGTYEVRPQMLDATGRVNAYVLHNIAVCPSAFLALPSSAARTWLVAWRKNGNIHLGWKTQAALPTGWDDFPNGQKGILLAADAFSGTWTSLFALGHNTSGAQFAIGSVVASEEGLQGAP